MSVITRDQGVLVVQVCRDGADCTPMHTVQLVVQVPASSAADFDALIALEDRLIEALDESHLVDGHDFGSGTANIFIHTNSATEAFATTRSMMAAMGYTEWGAAQRSLVGDEDYHRIWPVDSQQPFTLL